jgi:hypothetical protein
MLIKLFTLVMFSKITTHKINILAAARYNFTKDDLNPIDLFVI